MASRIVSFTTIYTIHNKYLPKLKLSQHSATTQHELRKYSVFRCQTIMFSKHFANIILQFRLIFVIFDHGYDEQEKRKYTVTNETKRHLMAVPSFQNFLGVMYPGGSHCERLTHSPGLSDLDDLLVEYKGDLYKQQSMSMFQI